MPNQPAEGVRHRTFRVHDDLWAAFLEKAHEEGRSGSAILTDWIREYVQPTPGN